MKYNIVTFESLDSTNDQATREKYPHGTVLVAQQQTQGRGQRGNKWLAEPNQNLTLSIIVEPTHISVYEQFRISQIAALAATDAISQTGVKCKIKWPNDLYVEDKKIGGILIEHCSMGETLSKSIIGIGININQTNFDPELPNPTSLALEGIKNQSPTQMLEKIQETFTQRYRQPHAQLHQDFMQNLWRAQGLYPYRDSQGEFQAQIKEIDPNTGAMTLENSKGEEKQYYFKEVEIII